MTNGFEQLGLSSRWTEELRAGGISEPAAVQSVAIPALLQGKDAVIRSGTGTGKTLAYLLPLLEAIRPEDKAVQAVVLAPTAELAMQIYKVASGLAERAAIRVQPLIGNASLQRQLDKLKQHPQLVIGTPGRVLECVSLRKLKLNAVRFAVVDEADYTFTLGEGGEAERFLQALPPQKQVVLCSATMPEAANAIMHRWMKSAVRIEPEEQGGAAIPAAVEHQYMMIEERDKIDVVRRYVRTVRPVSAMLFVNDTSTIAEVEEKLKYHGLNVGAIYGEQPKFERADVMRRFRDGKLKLLLATDVAARGLDAPEVTHVIHIDPPYDGERYVHRSGRTGRMGKSGTSVLLLQPNRRFLIDKFGKQLGITFREVKLAGGEVAAVRERSAQPKQSDSPSSGQASRRPAQAEGAAGRRLPAQSEPKRSAQAPKPAKPASPASAPKREKEKQRERDRKNKGAPKWLKAKREEKAGGPNADSERP